MAKGAKRGAAINFYLEVARAGAWGHECILWPFARNGHGYAVFGHPRGTVQSCIVSRVICADVHGEPPAPEYGAAHKCGNGHLGCINPAHLEWKTQVENKEDELRHGTRNRGAANGRAKLTKDQVVAIRHLARSIPQHAVAASFGIDQSTVSNIVTGKRWAHLS